MADLKQVSGDNEDKFIENKFRRFAMRVVNGEIGQFTYCMENDRIYHYQDGYWQEIRELEFLSKIENGIIDKKGNKTVTKFPVEQREKIIKNYKLLAFKHLEEFNKEHLLNFENYMIDPLGQNVLKHEPKYLSTIRIPYKYDALAKCELWIKSINQIFENNQAKINILQEFFGQCLTRDVKQEKGLLLLGESKAGKSTILHVLQNMVGRKNCSSIPLKYIINPVYTSQMIGKLINFDKDVSAKAVDFEEDFKKIVTGEEITSNDKYEAPFDFTPFCKMVLSANKFPRITDYSSAFYNRLALIPCERVFKPEERNLNLREQLLDELPGILNWAMEGLQRLSKRGKFEEVDFMKEALEELEAENTPSNLFFDEHIEVDVSDGVYIEKGELFKKYKEWCEKTATRILCKAIFSSIVFKKYHTKTPQHAHLDSGKRIWRNLKYVEFKTEHQPDEGWQE